MSERMTDERVASFDGGFSADKVALLMEASMLLAELKAERQRVADWQSRYEKSAALANFKVRQLEAAESKVAEYQIYLEQHPRQQVQRLKAENEALRKQQWLPIESAPTDGTDILLYTTDWGVIQGWFAAGQWSEHPEYGREYSGDVWVCADDALNIEIEAFPDGTYHHGNATHWMPLPTPPSAREES
jgi:hypothetical protein